MFRLICLLALSPPKASQAGRKTVTVEMPTNGQGSDMAVLRYLFVRAVLAGRKPSVLWLIRPTI